MRDGSGEPERCFTEGEDSSICSFKAFYEAFNDSFEYPTSSSLTGVDVASVILCEDQLVLVELFSYGKAGEVPDIVSVRWRRVIEVVVTNGHDGGLVCVTSQSLPSFHQRSILFRMG